MDESFVIYIWTGSAVGACISTEDKSFADKLKRWAESQGYKVTFSRGYADDGPQHQ